MENYGNAYNVFVQHFLFATVMSHIQFISTVKKSIYWAIVAENKNIKIMTLQFIDFMDAEHENFRNEWTSIKSTKSRSDGTWIRSDLALKCSF